MRVQIVCSVIFFLKAVNTQYHPSLSCSSYTPFNPFSLPVKVIPAPNWPTCSATSNKYPSATSKAGAYFLPTTSQIQPKITFLPPNFDVSKLTFDDFKPQTTPKETELPTATYSCQYCTDCMKSPFDVASPKSPVLPDARKRIEASIKSEEAALKRSIILPPSTDTCDCLKSVTPSPVETCACKRYDLELLEGFLSCL